MVAKSRLGGINNMYLLLDIGNTRCKAALYENGSLRLVQDLATMDINPTDIEAVIVASVAADEQLQVLKQKLKLTDVRWIHVQSEAAAFGIRNSYSEPKKLGVDRWLAMIAAKQQLPNHSIMVIDAGTAVTIDWVDPQGSHQGGWIIPGLAMQQRAVVSNTAKVLNANEFKPVLAPANNTATALQSGCLAAVIGAIQLAWQNHPTQQIILTGGDSLLLASHLDSLPIIIEPLLVFHGLSRYCRL